MTQEPATFPIAERPCLRPVEAFPVQDRGEQHVVLRDPADPDVSPIVVSSGAVDLLALLNGERTVDGILAALRLRGSAITHDQVAAFLQRLDEAGYLEGPRAQHRHQQRLAHFHSRPVRVAVHAGGAYPDGLAELPQFLAAGYVDADGPGRLPSSRGDAAPPRGLIAPHVDLHRGAPTYSWAYRALAEAQPADLYVVLGTCHTPVDGHFAATRKPYDTPLGTVPTDVDFAERLGRRWGADLWAGEFSHAAEHSVEFQAVYLRSLGLAGEHAAPMVPILCGSLHSLVMPPFSPRDVALVADFVEALRATIAEDGRRVTVIAAVDLAHIGPRFGDRRVVDARWLGQVDREDREMLDFVARGDAEGYFYQVMRDNDARRICGFTPIYLLAELMGQPERPARGDLLRYTQWVANDGSSSVTFASMVFP